MHIDTLKMLNSPFLRAIMLIAMLSLLGIPLFAGFIGKFLALKSVAVEGMFVVLSIIVLASLIEAVYYFKLVGFMFSKGEKKEPLKISVRQKTVFTLLAFSLILIGVAPMTISNFLLDAGSMMLDGESYVTMLVGG